MTTYTLDVAAGLPQVLAEHSGENATLYLYGLDLIGEQGAAWAHHLGDGLGSVRQLADGSGQVTLAQGTRPFGAPLWQAGSGSSGFGFTGEQVDASTGLVFLRARYYDAGTGRLLSVDPWRGNVQRPGTLNRYVYVLDNPVNGIDPSGLRCLFFDKNCDKVVEKAWDWVTDTAQDATTLPWRLIPGDFCLPGNLGCWGGEEYADYLEDEYYPDLPEHMYWTWYHPAQAWGLPEDSLKTMIIEDWFFELGAEDEIWFDGNHPATQLLKRHSGVNDGRDKFYKNHCKATEHTYDARQGKEGLLELLPIAVPAHMRFLVETIFLTPDSEKTVEGTLGTYSMLINDNGNGTATFWVWNTTSWESGTFGRKKSEERDETNPNWLSENLG